MKTLVALLWALIASIGMAFAAVNVNTATRAELEKLHGIGPVKAQAIIDYREKNGPFRSMDDLDKVPGIGKATLEKMREDVTFSGRTTGVADEKAPSERSSGTSRASNGSSADTAREKTERAAEKTKEKTERTVDKAKDKTEKAADKAKDKTEKAADKAKDKTEKAADKSKDKAEKAADKSKDKAQKASGAPLDINSASARDLAELPGIGKSRAEAIVKHRPYRSKNELVDKKVIPQGTYEQIKDHIVARQKK